METTEKNTGRFTRCARAAASALKKAGLSVARNVVKYAGGISGGLWSVANSGFIYKDYLQHRHPHPFEQASGVLALTASGLMLFTDRFPRVKRVAGTFGLLGTAAMGVGAVGQPGAGAQIFAACTTASLSLSLMFEKSFNRRAAQLAQSGNAVLRRAFTRVAKSPVVMTSALDATLSSLPMAFAAVARHDKPLLGVAVLWIAGGIAAMGTDDSVKAYFARQPKVPHIS